MNALEICCCSGGMALGFRHAGIEFAHAFDKDPDACDSYAANLGHRPIQMDVRDLLRLARDGWRPTGELDLIVADPPCTPWSRAGNRRGTEDERDLLADTCELIALLRPRAYLIGNVPGLDDQPNWHVVQDHVGGLRAHGYCVADYAALDAAAYGVPQHRIRPFWFGHLDGPCLRWPAPTHGKSAGPTLPGMALKPYVTCRDALQHLPLEQLGRPVHLRMRSSRDGAGADETRLSSTDAPAKVVVSKDTRKGGQILSAPRSGHPAASPDAPSPTVRSGGDGHSAPNLVLNVRHPPSPIDEPAYTIAARDRCQGATTLAVREPDPNRPPAAPDDVHRAITGARDQALLAWPWDRPSTLPPPGHKDENWQTKDGGRARSTPNAIVLSEQAAAILQGFPPGWLFAGATKKVRWSQIGQAMPPGLAEAVARAVAEQMASPAWHRQQPAPEAA